MKDAKAQGGKWSDPDFPPEPSSLVPPKLWKAKVEAKPKWATIAWRRPEDITGLTNSHGHPQLYHGLIEPNDIKQGAIGNCWVLSALSALAEFPDRVRNLFVNEGVDEHGIYGLKVTKNGVQRTVFVDDLLPTRGGKLFFLRNQGPELWASIIEKVWAKVHGSYSHVEGGVSMACLRDLTGAPAVVHRMTPGEPNPELFRKVKEADDRRFIICASCSSRMSATKAELRDMGLWGEHAYSII